MFMEGLGLEANERANKAALLLAHERYAHQFAAFVKGQTSRLSYVENQVADMLQACAAETNADYEYVKDRFSAFLRETVKSEIPADSTGIKNDTPSDMDEFVKTDVMDRGEVPGLGLDEALNEGVEKVDLGAQIDQLDPSFAKVLKEAMTAKDFVLIASVLAQNNADPALVDAFADALSHTNEMFSRERFVAAASGSPLTGRDAPRKPFDSMDSIPKMPGEFGTQSSKCARCGGDVQSKIASYSDICVTCTVDVQNIAKQTIEGARSDYDHWNEDADRMWWEEEGKHPHEPEFDDQNRDMGAEDAAWEELHDHMQQLPPDDLHAIADGTLPVSHVLNTQGLAPDGVIDMAKNILAEMPGSDYWTDRQQGAGDLPPEEDPFTVWPGRHPMGSKKEGDASWNEDGMGTIPSGMGTSTGDPSQQGLVQPQDPHQQYTCELCGATGTQQDMLTHVQNDHTDVLNRMKNDGQTMQPAGQPAPGQQFPMAAGTKEADAAMGDQQPAEVQPLPQTPGDRFDSIVQDLAERAAARRFSTATDADFHALASQLGVDEQQIRENLYAYAIFGNYAGVNGKLTDNAAPPDGYQAVQLQNGGNDAHQAVIPTDLVISKVAEDLNLDNNLADQMVRDHYGADLSSTTTANVQGQQTFYLPTELANSQNPDQSAQQPAQYDPTVGPAFQQTPPGAPVPAQGQPSPVQPTQ